MWARADPAYFRIVRNQSTAEIFRASKSNIKRVKSERANRIPSEKAGQLRANKRDDYAKQPGNRKVGKTTKQNKQERTG
jgi:hypothetical protein